MRFQDVLLLAEAEHAAHHGAQFLFGPAEEVFQCAALFAEAPLELVQAAFVHEGNDGFGGGFDDAGAPERGFDHRNVAGQAAAAFAHDRDIDRAEGFGVGLAQCPCCVAGFAGAFRLNNGEIVVEGVAGDLVHQVQAVECVAGVGDTAGGVGVDAGVLDIVAGQRCATEQNGDFESLAGHFLEVFAHHDGGFDQQSGHADRVGSVVLHGLQHLRDRDLDAEVDDPVAVVGQDDIDEVLADVVHVAFHRGEDDGAFFLALDPFHHRFEVGDGAFHRFGGLQHEGKLHLALAEQVADDFHAVEQDVVDDVERGEGEQRFVEVVGEALAVAVDDAVLQAALGGFGTFFLDRIGGLAAGEEFKQFLQRVVAFAAAVEDQVFRDLFFLFGDQVQRADF